jgi:hypothetical protein
MPTRDYDLTDVCGRLVKLARGDAYQSVNICTAANAEGNYEWIYHLPATPILGVGTIELQKFGSLDDFRAFLVDERDATLKQGTPI